MLSVIQVECHSAEGHYAECCGAYEDENEAARLQFALAWGKLKVHALTREFRGGESLFPFSPFNQTPKVILTLFVSWTV